MSISRDPLAWLSLGRDAIALGIAAATGITLWLRKRSARYWPTTYGRVEHASSFKDSGVWLTDISYSYRVAEDFYSGQFQLKARGEQNASNEVAHWKDRTIEIRYSPRKPELSGGENRRSSRTRAGRIPGTLGKRLVGHCSVGRGKIAGIPVN